MTETQSPPLTPADQARISRLKQRAAIVSVIASVVLTLGKAFAAWLSGSLALMSEAAHGLIDIGATLATLFAVRAADKPADDEHHYGHGKVESLTALAETALLFGLAGAVAWEAGNRLWAGQTHPVEVTPIVLGVLAAAILIDGTRWRALHIIARDTNSQALAADALHFAADFVSTLMTLGGLLLVLAGFPQGDALAALGVSIFIAGAAWRLARRTIDTLIDTAPKGLRDRLETAARETPGVVAIDWLRLRPGGGRVFGEIGVRVSRTLPLERVALIKEGLTKRLAEADPGSEITVTANPIQLDGETVMERVMLIAAHARVMAHHVTVQTLSDRLSISLDIEVDGAMSLKDAHDAATRLERDIQAEFGAETEVETHLEPLDVSEPTGVSCPWDVVEAVGRALSEEAEATGVLTEVHDVRVRSSSRGLVVNYHCRADGALDVAAVHAAVDRVERAVRQKRPDIARIVGHAEPVKP
jgi:cation diffusion facilitator family transporter